MLSPVVSTGRGKSVTVCCESLPDIFVSLSRFNGQPAFHRFRVLSQRGGSDAPCAMTKRRLARVKVLMLPLPFVKRLILQGAPKRKAKLPWFWPVELIDRVQMHG